MTRRDTIIFAVLINTGLLVILFATAMKSEDPSAAQLAVIETKDQTQELAVAEPALAPQDPNVDEVDHLLSQLSSRSFAHNAQGVLVDKERRQQNTSQARSLPVQHREEVAPSSVAQKPDNEYVEITVKRGDVLERIARANGTTVDSLMKTNNLFDSRLRIGQVLKVLVVKANGQTETALASKTEDSKSPTGPQYYTVRSGDNPWIIALRYRMNVDELLHLNGLDEDKARRLKPGDKLRVR